ncbi:SH3 domain-containing protein [Roseibium aggregatum]|uniref:SH3 domain-containing protein n=1 Tax=Roseibium aggregatum TaxID=187304 RepID=A0A926P2E3_9HYPH|nr:SH3 domain-containing protein [Roseibium aggregatum]MBD1545282.1 SH3 domain-containing protein [Roseibium aggregatum]
MFKYSMPSTQPIVAAEFHGIPEFSEEREDEVRDRPDLTIVRAPSAAPPRLRGVEAEDDGDLMIPDILRKPPDIHVDQDQETAWHGPAERNFRLLPVAAASAAGLLLVLAGGAMIYAAGTLSNRDTGTVSVKTISLEGQTSAGSDGDAGPQASAPVKAQAFDQSGFDLRFNSAKAADTHPGSLKIKSQDRIAKIPLEKTGKAGAGELSSRPGSRSHLPVLGYASVPNPHVGWDEGQKAISSAADRASLKDARIATNQPADAVPAGGTDDGTDVAASAPAVTPAAPGNTLDPGEMTETSTVTADVNLRSAAEKDAPVLTVVPNGTSVGVGSCDRWWCAVSFNGRTGFVGKKFVDGKS